MSLSECNPRTTLAGRDWPAAVVAGGYQTGVRLCRQLERRGVDVVCVEHDPAEHVFRSVYGNARLCPSPELDPDGWLAFMLDLLEQLGGAAVLIPTSDLYVQAIARAADRLPAGYLLHRRSLPLQALMAEKDTLYELAAREGVPHPRTATVGSVSDLTSFLESAARPFVVKPLHCRHWANLPPGSRFAWRKGIEADTPDELIAVTDEALKITPRVVVQELIPGAESSLHVRMGCYSVDGERLARFCFRKIRCRPFPLGQASACEPVEEPEIDAFCDDFLRRVGYAGLCEIEVKRDARDGSLRMIEANPRYTGGSEAAIRSGVELGWVHYLDLIGSRPTPIEPTHANYRHVNVVMDAASIVDYLDSGRLSAREILRSYRPPLSFGDLDPRDPILSLETLGDAARTFARRLIRGKR